MYSKNWIIVNEKPRPNVITILITLSKKLELSKDMWPHVIEAPLARSNVVLSRGTSSGSSEESPAGGHTEPNSTLGLREEWKKAQKNEKNKQTSLIMNRIIPNRKPSSTLYVCLPCMVDSRTTSRHHCVIVNSKIIRPSGPRLASNECCQLVTPANKKNAPAAPVNGHGLGLTIWKAWI